MDIRDWHAVHSPGSIQLCVVPLKSPRAETRVHSGQVVMSIHKRMKNRECMIKAPHMAKFKFPGRQKIHISKKWGFTRLNEDEFENMVAEKQFIPDG